MNTKKYLLVLDYLPARINDLKLIKEYVKAQYDLDMVIVSDMLSGEERNICDHVYHLPVSTVNYEDEVIKLIKNVEMECACILPFMDAVSGHAAVIAKRLGLYGDDATLSFAGIDKLKFREQESILETFLHAQNIVTPRSTHVSDYQQLKAFFELCPSGVVIKPVDGRANIGVKIVKAIDSLEASYAASCQAAPGSSIIAEELIAFDSEFSYDGVGVLSFLTQKVSQLGDYPVELGQIVPAQCSPTQALALVKAGQSMNLLSGQRYGAFHNEIKLNSITGKTFLVETNRRPAGMRIWDMANKVFGISLQKIWVDHLVQGFSDTRAIPEPIGSAFLINLLAPEDGTIKTKINQELMRNEMASSVKKVLNEYKYDIIDIKINVKENSPVYKIPKTNNDFCGYVCVYIDKEKINHAELMSLINKSWQSIIKDYIHYI
ncbi:ATP-grasp domain-containing protein [Pectobacterium versatile]|uniref:ATP-grasp domain-containing protein n=1 Tax=Pectobacterium versatile TaxID=2488639 RepID=UPI000B7BE797|nr:MULTISPECIES: hypothetical protein [Pectobacterium]ASN86722.1 ATP-grasp domain-containing protein [Pectobacterium versatile]MBA0162748.1 hypothetical protein [Pectobacterium versatile]MBD0846062.1 hypothetical protein [Pectobacterium carotovorum subsp. carotovorum]MBK4825000.1 hypothetical protein [Pectobacterium carotovorum subsp. carotovorum]MBN3058647.1 hypothetical protein [Pectobacterium versatile]